MMPSGLRQSASGFVLLLVSASNALALQPKEVFKLAEPSVVAVLASGARADKSSQGSGVVVAPLDVVTSCTIVDAATDIVVGQSGALRKAHLRFQDVERDLCQLRLDDPLPASKPAQWDAAGSPPEVGDDLYLVSLPRGLERTFARLMVAGLREATGASARLIQLDGAQEIGSAGGGLFDSKGQLVGILTFQFRQAGASLAAIPVQWSSDLPVRTADRLNTPVASRAPAEVVAAQAPADGRWYPKVGERWTYRLLDGKRNVGNVTVEVVESGSGRVRERITKSESPAFSVDREVSAIFQTKAFQPLVTLPGGYQFLELSSYLPPDVDVGSVAITPQIPGAVRINQLGVRNAVWSLKLAVRERVKTPAGEFEAWRIDASSSVNMQYGDARLRYSIWYSPQARKPVKVHLATLWPILTQSTFETLELSSQEIPR